MNLRRYCFLCFLPESLSYYHSNITVNHSWNTVAENNKQIVTVAGLQATGAILHHIPSMLWVSQTVSSLVFTTTVEMGEQKHYAASYDLTKNWHTGVPTHSALVKAIHSFSRVGNILHSYGEEPRSHKVKDETEKRWRIGNKYVIYFTTILSSPWRTWH